MKLDRMIMGLGTVLFLSFPAWASSGQSLAIVVSRDRQSLVVYRGSEVVATSNVSTGKPGHATPTGIFTILEKRVYHESNLYDSAPMPFMQRITWSGVALHESKHVPRRPASHGCVRLPSGFAKTLYGMTEPGVPVVIADEPLIPASVSHPNLFRPANPAANGTLLSDASLRLQPISDFLSPTEVALNESSVAPAPVAARERSDQGLRILITRRGLNDEIRDIQAMLNSLGFDAGEPDGRTGRATTAAINAFKLTRDLPVRGALLTEATVDAIYAAAGRAKPPAAQLFVRQNFKPLFDAPIGLRNPEIALGTRFLQLTTAHAGLGTAEWFGFTMPDLLSDATRKRLGITGPAGSLAETLDRLDIPAELREKIEADLAPGTTITITDGGLGTETGAEGTYFITLTRTGKKG